MKTIPLKRAVHVTGALVFTALFVGIGLGYAWRMAQGF
jgi:hypothetical protein